MQRLVSSILSAGVLTAAATAQGTVWVVDEAGGPGSQFSDIQPAVDAASDGDVVLVRSGTYDDFDVDGKGLAVVADAGSDVLLQVPASSGSTRVNVRNLALDQSVLLQGLTVQGLLNNQALGGGPGLLVENSLGPVWVEDCRLYGNLVSSVVLAPSDAMGVEDSASVNVVRCDLFGENPDFVTLSTSGTGISGDGLDARDSFVSVYDSSIVAGNQELGSSPAPGLTDTARGAVVEGGTLFASGTRIQGTDGVDLSISFLGCGTDSERGGDALVVVGEDTRVYTLDEDLVPGRAGAVPRFDGNPCRRAPDGQVVNAPEGTVFKLWGRSYPFHVTSPVRGGQNATLHFEADPGELLFLGVSPDQRGLLFLQWLGALQLGVPDPALLVAVTPPSGVLDLDVPMVLLGPGLDSVVVYLQALVVQTTPVFGSPPERLVLGSPSALVVLNEAF